MGAQGRRTELWLPDVPGAKWRRPLRRWISVGVVQQDVGGGGGSYLPVQDLRLATEEAVAVVTAQVNAPLGACALEGRKTSKGGVWRRWWGGRGESGLFFALPGPTYPNSRTLSLSPHPSLIPGPGFGVPGTWSSSWGCRIGRLCDQPCCSNRGQRGCGGRSCRVGEGLGHREKGRGKARDRETERDREREEKKEMGVGGEKARERERMNWEMVSRKER